MRVVCISDTHGLTLRGPLPEGDMLIHAGDLSLTGEPHEVAKELAWLRKQPHKFKFVIGGNHDNALAEMAGLFDEQWKPYRDYTPLRYLCGSKEVIEHDGRKWTVFGSSVIPFCGEFRAGARAYMLDATTARHWGYAPKCDILITHGPPKGYGDSIARYGDACLLAYVKQVKPKLHVFGHVHIGYGLYDELPPTTFVNAAQVDMNYRPVNTPIIVDL